MDLSALMLTGDQSGEVECVTENAHVKDYPLRPGFGQEQLYKLLLRRRSANFRGRPAFPRTTRRPSTCAICSAKRSDPNS
ncbi:hypothetical protein [Solimonas marina]|uniref:Uncharacterized protein n=1 Tax=Solimonas marina TaxID=2714601 RepID=A0A969W9L5_9GAMM|nr:hypothetical protein [Solimonas marina]NKF22084.1 hypothetical protein [Solimonas marina]